MLLRHAWKELRAEPRFALLFVLNLALGLSGLIAMEAFRDSLGGSLRENARNLLAGDLSLASRRVLTPEETQTEKELAAHAEKTSRLVETFSMIQTPAGSRLVSLRAVGENYPLRGYVDLEKRGKISEGGAHPILGADRVWIDPDLARQLKLKIGDPLRLGAADFIVDDFMSFDPTQSFRALALAGRVVLSVEGLEKTGLIRPEGTVSWVRLYQLPAEENAENLARDWNAKFSDPAIQVKAAGQTADESGRMLAYLGDFLGLSALVALFLSSLGGAYLFRTWLVRRSRVLAMHQVLGLPFWRAAAVPALQSLLLASASVPLAVLLGQAELAALGALVSELSPVKLDVSLSPASILVAVIVATVGSVFVALPFLASLRAADARDLLGGRIPEPRFDLRSSLLFLPSLLLFYALAVFEAQSFRNAGLFCGALLASLGILLLAGWLLLRAFGWLAKKKEAFSWTLRQALLQLSRRGLNSLSVFVALALGTLLLNLLPQLRASLLTELENPEPGKLPSFFLFDIQEDQLASVQEKLSAMGLTLDNLSPLVRARLLTVNNEVFERRKNSDGFRTREEENEARFRNRGFNLSYRPGLTEAETLVEGAEVNPAAETPELSVEMRFAERLGMKLGDQLRFDVQGVEVTGKIVNFRRVKWTSFQPNFFVLFPEGVLDGAPKIFLGSLRDLPDAKKNQVQSLLASSFPNISVVDVKATVGRALDLINRMRWCLNLMSAISLFAGFVVLFSIVNRQAELRRWDVNLIRVLGAGAKDIRAQQFWEFGLLSSTAGAFGAFISILFTWVASYYLFDGTFTVALPPLLLSVVGTTALGLFVSWLGARQIWRRSAAELLQEQPL